jgi:hypothetical protein
LPEDRDEREAYAFAVCEDGFALLDLREHIYKAPTDHTHYSAERPA